MISKCNVFVCFLILSFAHPAAAGEGGGTGIGNGGDIISRALEATREALVQTLARLRSNPGDLERMCSAQECRAWIAETMEQIVRLSLPGKPTPFLLREEPLMVVGPDGQERPVDARTILGPEGSIEFHYDSVRNYSPLQMLTLMTHEFGHKVSFRGRYVEDNVATESFPSGRRLLDSAAFAVASYAEEVGLIGRQFSLNDRFSCMIDFGTGAQPVWVDGFSPRSFYDRRSYDVFSTTISKNARDMSLYVDEYGRSRLYFRAEMNEQHGCRAGESDGRRTTLQLVRVYVPVPGSVVHPEEILTTEVFEGRNPICEDSREPLRIIYGRLRLECTYTGSFGQTN